MYKSKSDLLKLIEETFKDLREAIAAEEKPKNHGKAWTKASEEYLYTYWGWLRNSQIALSLGRTEYACQCKFDFMKSQAENAAKALTPAYEMDWLAAQGQFHEEVAAHEKATINYDAGVDEFDKATKEYEKVKRDFAIEMDIMKAVADNFEKSQEAYNMAEKTFLAYCFRDL